jgi:hypothetical protein
VEQRYVSRETGSYIAWNRNGKRGERSVIWEIGRTH